ncbi:hypothetical protein [Roseiterribacter gracilis]|uniref:Uncharacterized protein n=1 Tax=Roseiterribacter gracilis TaxID=2812848 RepID=A0A8S8XAW7_9PROT|nr:hypothetical protein TMPK1_21310 [Rhodospirillales bacterium TMPK1]
MFRLEAILRDTWDPAEQAVHTYARIAHATRRVRIPAQSFRAFGYTGDLSDGDALLAFLQSHREHIETHGAAALIVHLSHGFELGNEIDWTPDGFVETSSPSPS